MDINTSRAEDLVGQIISLLRESTDDRQIDEWLADLRDRLKATRDFEYREKILRRLQRSTGGFGSLSDGILTPKPNSKLKKDELNKRLGTLTTALFNETKLLIAESQKMDFPRKKDPITELLDQIISLLEEGTDAEDVVGRLIRGLKGDKENMETILDQRDEKNALKRIKFGLESKVGKIPPLPQIHLTPKPDSGLTEDEMNKKLNELTDVLHVEVNSKLAKLETK